MWVAYSLVCISNQIYSSQHHGSDSKSYFGIVAGRKALNLLIRGTHIPIFVVTDLPGKKRLSTGPSFVKIVLEYVIGKKKKKKVKYIGN